MVTGEATRVGLIAGDVLLAINGVAFKNKDQVDRITREKPKSVALLILRDGYRIYLPVEIRLWPCKEISCCSIEKSQCGFGADKYIGIVLSENYESI